MTNGVDILAAQLQKTIDEKDKGKKIGYDTQATVVKVDDETIWVNIPGGVDETPVARTVNAKEGDVVQIRVAGGRAWIVGNYTAPATDDTKAEEASVEAKSADAHAAVAEAAAASAIESADLAQQAADIAAARAEEATESANEAKDMAREAGAQATIATTYANGALNQLGVVEDVIGTLNWITQHGNYILTTDTVVQDKKVYYRQDEYVFLTADTEVDSNKAYYTAVITEVETPVAEDIELYFELRNGQYIRTHDTEIDETKTYYTIDLTYVEEPSAESLSTYYEQVINYQAITAKGNPSEQELYELQLDEAVSNYINTHLALTDEGLYVISDKKAFVKTRDTEIIDAKEYYTRSGTEGNYTYTKVENPVVADIPLYFEQGNGYKVLLSSQDLRIIDSTGVTAATYGDGVSFDPTREFTIGNEDVYIKYFDSDHDAIADSIAIKADNIIFGNKSLDEQLDSMSSSIDTMTGRVDNMNTVVQGVSKATQDSIDELESVVSSYDARIERNSELIGQYDGFIIVRPQEPSITVGADTDSYIKILSTKTSTFKLTEDTEIVEGKEYYTRTEEDGHYIYTLVTEPVAADLPNYYEIEKTTKQSKLQLIADNKEVAYLSDERLHAPSAVVNNLYMQTVNAMTGETIGGIGWVMRSNGHLSMRRMK